MKSLRLSEAELAAIQRKRKLIDVDRRLVSKPGQVWEADRSKPVAPDRWPLVLRDQIVEVGLPEPFREFVWHPTRNFRADLCWPDRARIVEVDGAVHRIKGKFERDIERHNLLTLAGWQYLRVTPQMVRYGEALALVKDFLEK